MKFFSVFNNGFFFASKVNLNKIISLIVISRDSIDHARLSTNRNNRLNIRDFNRFTFFAKLFFFKSISMILLYYAIRVITSIVKLSIFDYGIYITHIFCIFFNLFNECFLAFIHFNIAGWFNKVEVVFYGVNG